MAKIFMTVEEAQDAIERLKLDGYSDDDLFKLFYLMFIRDELDVDQFNALVNLLGYHLTDEFLALSTKEQKEYFFANKSSNKKNKDSDDK